MVEVTEADKVLADAVAEAIASVSVAYSHATNSELRTINRKWFVHDTCEDNPFDKREWVAVFDNKTAANEYARDLRKERAYAAAATLREAAAKAERDRIVAWLREMGSIRGGVADAIEALEHLEEKQP